MYKKRQSALGLVYLHLLGGSTIIFRYCLLGGDTAAPSGLYARLCHAFLVIHCKSVAIFSYLTVVSMYTIMQNAPALMKRINQFAEFSSRDAMLALMSLCVCVCVCVCVSV